MGDRRRLPPAVTVFPLLVLAGGALGALVPGWFHPLTGGLPWLLGFVMLCMGVTIAPDDLRRLARRPWMVLIGLLAHYVIMPLVGWGVAAVLHLPPMLAVGVILVGCAPSGTASNVICFLGGGDVALSVSISIVSTLVAPIFMPLLTHLLAGAWVQVPVGSMMGDVLRTVVVPVVVGALLRWLLPGMVRRAAPVLPWISAMAVAGIVAVVVSGSAAALLASGGLALLAVVLHNGAGLGLGALAGRLAGFGRRERRALIFEIGIQNSGLAAALAGSFFGPVAALPAAIFSVWHNVTGSGLAWAMARSDRRRAVEAGERGPGRARSTPGP